jgi:hypothetical protein
VAGVSACWHIQIVTYVVTLKDGTHHQDLGANHFERRSTKIKAKRLAAQIAKLGFQVELRPLTNAA